MARITEAEPSSGGRLLICKNLGVLVIGTLLSVASARQLAAQTSPGAPVIEPITVVLQTRDSPPNDRFEQFYPNEFDLNHPKKLTFQGTLTNPNLNQGHFIDLWFDWVDPRDPVGTPPHTSAITTIIVAAGETKVIGGTSPNPAIVFTIPFCPPQVSIHLENETSAGGQAPIQVNGQFIHQCLIPEPTTAALIGIAVLALTTRRNKRQL